MGVRGGQAIIQRLDSVGAEPRNAQSESFLTGGYRINLV
ncbi:hypothetical protein I553_0050 [Mycobacterium xenopi 4042]|uniref:Uncharacterized protein n=1 Tax=Mycobacterium xenopi 4042 TaxID=1299334 RepID=X8DEM4_MYCXE|nr:hypothetical protein I553_4978 [Mycobacterium xenopi 4042]EUA44135.1 hypothetical protein I553_0073 [Mycobacterium xenopi 4042]EUA65935.1 hypothetical protein I553_0050 [Mycobacterium xenopi 4042]